MFCLAVIFIFIWCFLFSKLLYPTSSKSFFLKHIHSCFTHQSLDATGFALKFCEQGGGKLSPLIESKYKFKNICARIDRNNTKESTSLP